MFRCVLVATLCVVAWGAEDSAPLGTSPDPVQPSLQDLAAPAAPVKMMDYCFFGQFPSATCRFKCHLQDMEAYCDQEQHMCLCTADVELEEEEDKDSQEVLSPLAQHPETLVPGQPHVHISITPVPAADSSSTQEEQDGQHHVVFYVVDLDKVFGKNKVEGEVEGGASSEAPDNTEAAGAEVKCWSLQHSLALVIVVILLGLVSLELYRCYKKQSGAPNVEPVFKMPTTNKF